jgi:hypothetical protein
VVPSDHDVKETLRVLAGLYGRPHAVLHDGVRAGGLTSVQRRMLTRHTALHEDDVRRWVIAAAAAVPSTFLRGIIAMIQWVTPSPCPFRSFSHYREAEEWLQQALRRAGLLARPQPPVL